MKPNWKMFFFGAFVAALILAGCAATVASGQGQEPVTVGQAGESTIVLLGYVGDDEDFGVYRLEDGKPGVFVQKCYIVVDMGWNLSTPGTAAIDCP